MNYLTDTESHVNNIGLFYKVKDEADKTRGYIYGTVHKFSDNDFKINQIVINSFKKSPKLILEVNQTQHENFHELGSSTIGRLVELKKRLADAYPGEILEDINFLYDGVVAGKKIIALEELEEQKAIMKSISENSRFQKQITSEEVLFAITHESIAHKTSNEELIKRIAYRGLSDDGKKLAFIERNVKWAKKVERVLQDGDDKIFIAVGTGHLVGEASLVNLLREKGWKLKQIEA